MYENIELITAIITPFTANDQIDYVALDRLADRLLHDGTQGFVIGGTTGESPTLTHDEKIALYTHFAAHIGNRGVVVTITRRIQWRWRGKSAPFLVSMVCWQ